MNILLKLPTRGRPEKAVAVLKEYIRLASLKHDVRTVISIDEDDLATVARLTGLDRESWLGYFQYRTGPAISKIHACNRDITEADVEWANILMLISDDMIPVVQGWDDVIAKAMVEHHPDLDGCLHFNDGHTGPRLNTLPIMGRERYKKFGYFYHPEYISLWCDNEFTEVHKPTYIDTVVIEHQHPANGIGREDDLLKFNNSLSDIDRKTYLRRKARGFPQRQPLLSICVCTTAERAVDLARLRYVLKPQTGGANEILVHDGETPSVGTKRQELLDRANGRYICFVDDDDIVPFNYVDRILGTLWANPDVDCIGFIGEMTTDGLNPKTFVHRLTEKKEWYQDKESGVYYRPPHHLCPVRADLARRAGFRDMERGEDHDYSMRLWPLLKTSVFLDGEPMYYYLFNPARKPYPKPLRPVPTLPKPRIVQRGRAPAKRHHR